MTPCGSWSAIRSTRAACGDRARRATLTTDGRGMWTDRDQFLDLRQDARDDHGDPRGAGMQAVVLQSGPNRRQRRRERTDRAGCRIWRPARDRCARTPGHSRRRDSAPRACRTKNGDMALAQPAQIVSSASRVTCGSMPRSMSLAPSSRMTASVPCGTDQSSRASPSGGGVAGHAGIGDRPTAIPFRGQRRLQARQEAVACRQGRDPPSTNRRAPRS